MAKSNPHTRTGPPCTSSSQVREVAAEAIARARRGDGPTLIEAETYRFRGHSLADPDELRSKEEKEFFAKRDPIPVRAFTASGPVNPSSPNCLHTPAAAVLCESRSKAAAVNGAPRGSITERS